MDVASHLPVMPLEVLSYIFKFLPIEDRKNIRLVCHSWNEACHSPEIIRDEKFVFYIDTAHDDMEQLGACIVRSRKLRPRLEFRGLPLKRLPLIVWQSCGAKIQDLIISSCEVNDETLMNIITCCHNMTHFRIEDKLEAFSCSEAAVDELIKLEIVRRNLVSLELFVELPLATAYQMSQKIFQIFPCIRTLGLNVWAFDSSQKLPTSIDDFMTRITIMKPYWEMPTVKFRRFKTALYIPEGDTTQSHFNCFFNFFSLQTQLERLQLDMRNFTDTEVKVLLFHILENSPKLEALEIHSVSNKGDVNFLFTIEEFGVFLRKTSQIKLLGLKFHRKLGLIYSHADDLNLLPPTAYTRLEKLRLGERVDRIFICS